jgi:hypothetical protein
VAPVLSASDLLAAVPGLDDVGVVLTMQDVANKPGASPHATYSTWLTRSALHWATALPVRW